MMWTLAVVVLLVVYLGVGYGVLALGTMAGLAGLDQRSRPSFGDEPHPVAVVIAWPLAIVMVIVMTVAHALTKSSEIVQSQAIGARERYISRQHQLKAKNAEVQNAEREVDSYLGYRA